ncbi:MAG: hypothetical protein ABIM46_08170, partial [candidate division WOR-3 bacterium]
CSVCHRNLLLDQILILSDTVVQIVALLARPTFQPFFSLLASTRRRISEKHIQKASNIPKRLLPYIHENVAQQLLELREHQEGSKDITKASLGKMISPTAPST